MHKAAVELLGPCFCMKICFPSSGIYAPKCICWVTWGVHPLFFKGRAELLSRVAVPFHIPTSYAAAMQLLPHPGQLGVLTSFYFGHSTRYRVLVHCGFNLRFKKMLTALSCAHPLCSSVYSRLSLFSNWTGFQMLDFLKNHFIKISFTHHTTHQFKVHDSLSIFIDLCKHHHNQF